MWCAALRIRHHPCRRQDRAVGRYRDHRNRADARRSRQPGKARRQSGQEGQGQRQGRQGGSSTSSTARWCCCATASRRAFSSASRRKSAPFSMLGPADVEAGALRLQCRGRLGQGRQQLFKAGVRARQEGRRGRGGDLGQDRDPRSRPCHARSAPSFWRRWASRRPASTA